MRIYGAKTIEEFKEIRDSKIEAWIDSNFERGAVTWEYVSASKIKITDKTGDTMILNLDEID